MQRIDTATAVANRFVDRDPTIQQEATHFDAPWCNSVQEEIANAIEGAGFVLDPSNESQLYAAIQSLVAPSVRKKNALVNGAFDVNQRFPTATFTVPVGITSATTEPFYVDRWRHTIPTGAGDLRVFQTRHPLDITGEDLPQNLVAPTFYLNLETVAGFVNEPPTIEQRIEGVRTFAGLVVVVSFYARLNSGTSTITPRLTQNFGSFGSPPVVLTGNPISLTSSWARYEQAFTLADLAGRTLGVIPATAYFDDYLELQLEFSQNQTFDVDLSHVQLERGAQATEYESTRFGDELAACLRFYEKSLDYGVSPIFEDDAVVAGAFFSVSVPNDCKGANSRFRVLKRGFPNVVWYAGGASASTPARIFWGATRTVSGLASGTASIASTGTPTCTTNPGALAAFEANWTADAEL